VNKCVNKNRHFRKAGVKGKAATANKLSNKWRVNTDGAIRPDRNASGLAAIVRNEAGQILYWWQKRVHGMTCNEAEYAAVIFAMEQIIKISSKHPVGALEVYCDSRLVVDQMQGRAATHSPALQKAQARLKSLVSRLRLVEFHHISREQNRLADALAFEAVEGWQVQKSGPKTNEPHADVVKEFFSSWRSS
jgi:ribonuclease HI